MGRKEQAGQKALHVDSYVRDALSIPLAPNAPK
jgi:hypothetical protein